MRAFFATRIWVSPVRDISAFSKRYWSLCGVIAIVLMLLSLLANQYGYFFLWTVFFEGNSTSIGRIGPPPICNFSLIAKTIFCIFFLLEFNAITGLFVHAFWGKREARKPNLTVHRSIAIVSREKGIRAAIPKGLFFVVILLFCHLGLYAMAFNNNDACLSTRIKDQVFSYWALSGAAVMYSLGSTILLGFCLIFLRDRLLISDAG